MKRSDFYLIIIAILSLLLIIMVILTVPNVLCCQALSVMYGEKCDVYNIDESPYNLVSVTNESEYQLIHQELNPSLHHSYTDQTFDYTNFIVTTWVFQKKNETNNKIVVRAFHSLLDYLVGNDDPRIYKYYCLDGNQTRHNGSNMYIIKDPTVYVRDDLSSYCSKSFIKKLINEELINQ